MMRTLCGVFAVALMLSSVAAASSVTFQYDDGTTDVSLGTQIGGDFWFANAFFTPPGGAVIEEIHVNFNNDSVFVGDSFQVLLYEDLDDDGSPLTGLSLVQVTPAVVQFPVSDDFEVVDIPDTAVSGGFFVGAFYSLPFQVYPIAVDVTSPMGMSWIAANATAGTLDINDPVATATDNPVAPTEFFGFPSNVMVRAEGETLSAPIPEPATLLGVAGAVAAMGVYLRRRRLAQ